LSRCFAATIILQVFWKPYENSLYIDRTMSRIDKNKIQTIGKVHIELEHHLAWGSDPHDVYNTSYVVTFHDAEARKITKTLDDVNANLVMLAEKLDDNREHDPSYWKKPLRVIVVASRSHPDEFYLAEFRPDQARLFLEPPVAAMGAAPKGLLEYLLKIYMVLLSDIGLAMGVAMACLPLDWGLRVYFGVDQPPETQN